MNKYQAKLLSLLAIPALLHASPSMATVVTYEYVLEYQSETFGNAEAYERRTHYDPNEEEDVTRWEPLYHYRNNGDQFLRGKDNVYGFKGAMTGTAPGTQITLSMSIDLVSQYDDPKYHGMSSSYASQGMYFVKSCDLGDGYCAVRPEFWTPEISGAGFRFGNYSGTQGRWFGYASGDMSIGGNSDGTLMSVIMTDSMDGDTFDRTETRHGYYDYYRADFSFVEARLPDCGIVRANLPAGGKLPPCRDTIGADIPAAPLPASMLLLGGGLAGFGWLARRRRARLGQEVPPLGST